MKRHILFEMFTLIGLSVSTMAFAQQDNGSQLMTDHAAHMSTPVSVMTTPIQGGQSAFAAIQEIVTLLIDDPATDWDTVDMEALRKHLIDMDNVTLRSDVSTQNIDGGARFSVTSNDPAVAASVQRMVSAHAAITQGAADWVLSSELNDDGATLIATGDSVRMRALGFIGVRTVGAHHQSHHLALAQGGMPH